MRMMALRVGGALHFVANPATLVLARVVQQQQLHVHVPVVLRKILAVLGGAIVLAVATGGVLTLLLRPSDLTTAFGMTFVASWALFWLYRLAVQLFIYGPLIPSSARWAHWSLSAVLLTKSFAYAVVAFSFLAH